MEHVKRETLRIYEELLCLKYTRLTGAAVWHEDVEAYAAHDARDGELQGYFFLDLHPRPGKYAHQCVYPLQVVTLTLTLSLTPTLTSQP